MSPPYNDKKEEWYHKTKSHEEKAWRLRCLILEISIQIPTRPDTVMESFRERYFEKTKTAEGVKGQVPLCLVMLIVIEECS